MNAQEQLEQIEISDAQAKDLIDDAIALERLYQSSPDFKRIILDGYFKEEASRLALMLAEPYSNPNLTVEQHQVMIKNKLLAIGELRQYFLKIFHLGNGAEQALRDNEEARQDILSEE
jgi:hypothetical protein